MVNLDPCPIKIKDRLIFVGLSIVSYLLLYV